MFKELWGYHVFKLIGGCAESVSVIPAVSS